MEDLKLISQDIKDILNKKREEMSLSFVEDTHTYYLKNENGVVVSNYPSVSKVLHAFYTPFDASSTGTFKRCNGDPEAERLLLEQWANDGTYASNMGSRVHYELESHLVSLYGNYKDVRRPIFECDEDQTIKGDAMIKAGKEYIELMHSRNCVLLDTEMVLGDIEFGYTGQPDKVWLVKTLKDEVGLIISDWKTNKKKNFEVQWYTNPMLKPFESYPDTALSHYYLQLPLYGKLLLKMLKGTKYEGIKLLRNMVVHLEEDGTFTEYTVPKDISQTVLDFNIREYL